MLQQWNLRMTNGVYPARFQKLTWLGQQESEEKTKLMDTHTVGIRCTGLSDGEACSMLEAHVYFTQWNVKAVFTVYSWVMEGLQIPKHVMRTIRRKIKGQLPVAIPGVGWCGTSPFGQILQLVNLSEPNLNVCLNSRHQHRNPARRKQAR